MVSRAISVFDQFIGRFDGDANPDDFDDRNCKPDVNNWVPCVCVPSYMMVMASIEMFIFLVAFILFFYQIRKK